MRYHLYLLSLLTSSLTFSIVLPEAVGAPPSDVAVQTIAQSADNPRETSGDAAERLLLQGRELFYRGDFAEAITALQAALTQYQALGDTPERYRGESNSLAAISEVYIWTHHYDQALQLAQQALEMARAHDNLVGEVWALNLVGVAQQQLGNIEPDVALEQQQQTVKLAQTSEDVVLQAVSFVNLGVMNLAQNNFTAAQDHFQQSLSLLQTPAESARTELSRQYYQALTLQWAGLGALGANEENQAYSFFEQSLAISQDIGSRAVEAGTLFAIGDAYYKKEDYPLALTYLQQALTVYQETNNQSAQADMLWKIADVYEAQQDYDQAREHYEQSLERYREVGNQTAVANALNRIGSSYFQQKDYPSALSSFQQILIIYQETHNQSAQADIFWEIANVYNAQQDYNQARESYGRVLELYRELDDHDAIGLTLTQIGHTYSDQGKYTEALDFHQQALNLAQQSGNRLRAADQLSSIALIYRKLELSGKAFEIYQEALAIRREAQQTSSIAPDLEWEGILLWSMGFTSYDQGQYDIAVDFYRQALATYRQVKLSLNDSAKLHKIQEYESLLLSGIGNVYFQQEKYTDALMFYQQALTVVTASENRVQQIYPLRHIANTYRRLKQPDDALRFYQQALVILSTEKDHLQDSDRYAEAGTLWSLANFYFDQKQYEQAIQIYQQSLIAYRGRPLDQANVLRAMSDTYGQLGQSEQASSAYKQSLERAQSEITTQTQTTDLVSAPDNSTGRHGPELNLAGVWRIDTAQTSEGNTYTGTVTINPVEQLYGLLWQTSLGNRSGIGLVDNDYLYVGWGEGDLADYGVGVYRIGNEGSLIGQWANASGLMGTEAAIAEELGQLEGKYAITGLNFNGGQYQGTLEVHRTGETYQLFWDTGIEYRGIGFRTGDYLVVGWGSSGVPGVAAYQLTDNRATGRLTVLEQSKLTTETLVWSQVDTTEDYVVQILELRREANKYLRLGQSATALDKLQQALTIAHRARDRKREADILQFIGNEYLEQEQFLKALDAYQRSLTIKHEMSDPYTVATTLNAMGITYYRQGQYSDALNVYQQALTIYNEDGSPVDIAAVLGNIGLAYDSQGQYSKALQSHQQALDIYRQENDRSGEGIALNNIGLTYTEQGDYAKALEIYQQALTSFEKAGLFSRKISTLRHIGLVYANQGDYSEALSFFDQALVAQRSALSKNRFEEAVTLSSIAQVNISLGQYAKALEDYQHVLAEYQELGYRNAEGKTLRAIGLVYGALNEYSKALEFYHQALDIHREVGNRADEISTLNNIGLTYSKTGQYTKALEIHQQALAVEQAVGSLPRRGRTLNNLGQAYQGLQRYSDAENAYEQALLILNEIGDRPSEALTLSNLGKLLIEQDQPELATVFLKQSVNIYEDIRKDNNVLDQELQSSYTDTIADTYRQLADVLLTQGRIPEAQRVLDLLKVEEIREYTSRAVLTSDGIKYSSLEQPIIDIHGDLIAFGREFSSCQQSNTCSPELLEQAGQLNKEYVTLVDMLQATVRENRYDDKYYQDPDNLGAEAQALLATNPDSVLIYPLVTENKLWLLYASQGVVGSIGIDVTQKELAETVQIFGEQLQSGRSLPALQLTSQKLYNWLIQPLDQILQTHEIQHLIFANDRVTRYIPMAALYNGEKYLIEQYALSSILSTDLTDTDSRLGAVADSQVLGLGVTQAVADFNPLPAVGDELDAIVQSDSNDSQGIYPGQVYLNSEFTLENLKANVPTSRILHIATHAEFIPGRPKDSYILLGNGDSLKGEDIDFLADAYLRNLHLVVLSACQTALGGATSDGSEIAGMSAYFLKTGRAESVLASLWAVNDSSTSLLMQNFYAFMASGELTKAEALQEAQLSLLYNQDVETRLGSIRAGIIPQSLDGQPLVNETPISHPYHWAPFIMIGNAL